MMMTKKDGKPKILLDCDVVIHFTKAGKQLLLPKIYPGQFIMLSKVYQELERRKSTLAALNNFLQWSGIEVVDMPKSIDIIREYALLRKTMGDGEAACLAVARHTKDCVASSNLKDIKAYCELHQIVYLTTMDILAEAYKQGIMNEAECDQFIYDVVSKDSKLPFRTIQEYFNENKK